MNSSELKGYLTGLILGDGSIDKGVTKRSFRIKSINHDFIDKIERDLKDTTPFTIDVILVEASYKNGVSRRPYKELKIKSHPYFNKKYNFFYDDFRNRRITKESLNWLTPEGIANWYMSDGYIVHVGKNSGEIKDRRVELATDRYSPDDVKQIQQFFEDTYNFKTSLVKRKHGVYRIRFSLLSAQYLFLMINEYITPSFQYKLNLQYTYHPKWMSDDYYRLMMKLQSAETQTNNAVG